MKTSDQGHATRTTRDMDIRTWAHAHKHMFICLAILGISTPACDSNEALDRSDIDERARPETVTTPNDVYIESISAHGTGCPKGSGSAQAVVDSDRRSFLVAFTDMLLQRPGGGLVQTINCTVAISLHIPGGWQVSVATVNTRGYAFLEWGIVARQTSNYFFAGDHVGYAAHSDLEGPYDDLYVFTDKIPFQSIVWSPCGTSSIFAIDTSLVLNAIDNPEGNAVFNNTTIDGRFQKKFHLKWRPC